MNIRIKRINCAIIFHIFFQHFYRFHKQYINNHFKHNVI